MHFEINIRYKLCIIRFLTEIDYVEAKFTANSTK